LAKRRHGERDEVGLPRPAQRAPNKPGASLRDESGGSKEAGNGDHRHDEHGEQRIQVLEQPSYLGATSLRFLTSAR
jgi:hypothetical protein